MQEDWLGTKDEIGSSNVHLDSSNPHLDLVPQELILVTAPKLQEDWIGTQDEIGSSNVHLDSSNLHLDLVPQELILVTAPKLQEDWMGTRSDQLESMLIKSMSLLKPGATRCHGTRIARGVPLPVYINLDLYSGFWCTSHCVVF